MMNVVITAVVEGSKKKLKKKIENMGILKLLKIAQNVEKKLKEKHWVPVTSVSILDRALECGSSHVDEDQMDDTPQR